AGPAAGRSGVVPRGLVGRPDWACELLATRAGAAAHFDGPAEATEFGVIEPGFGIGRAIFRAEAEVRGERRRVDNFSGVEGAVGVKGALDFAEGSVESRAKHLGHEGTAPRAITMLAGKRAAVFENERRYGIRDRFELANAVFGLHVDYWAHMQAADRGVGVD